MDTGKRLDARILIRSAPGRPFDLDVCLSAPPGITVLFGPSGSGKTTTLAAIAGLVRPDAGRVTMGDEVWFDSSCDVHRPVEDRALSFMFQSLALFPHLTSLENVEYGIDRALPRAARRQRALDMLERMHVPHLAARRPGTISGGEAQRVALARAFARSPRLVLLDEAFSSLDRELRRTLAADVRAMVFSLGVPAILVTHFWSEARAIGDSIVLLENGRVKAAGQIQQLLPNVVVDATDDVAFPLTGCDDEVEPA